MKTPDLAHAYVTLDRFVFFRLQTTSKFESCCAQVEQRLEANQGLNDLKELCAAGADRHELLWLLKGCEGLSGFRDG